MSKIPSIENTETQEHAFKLHSPPADTLKILKKANTPDNPLSKILPLLINNFSCPFGQLQYSTFLGPPPTYTTTCSNTPQHQQKQQEQEWKSNIQQLSNLKNSTTSSITTTTTTTTSEIPPISNTQLYSEIWKKYKTLANELAKSQDNSSAILCSVYFLSSILSYFKSHLELSEKNYTAIKDMLDFTLKKLLKSSQTDLYIILSLIDNVVCQKLMKILSNEYCRLKQKIASIKKHESEASKIKEIEDAQTKICEKNMNYTIISVKRSKEIAMQLDDFFCTYSKQFSGMKFDSETNLEKLIDLGIEMLLKQVTDNNLDNFQNLWKV